MKRFLALLMVLAWVAAVQTTPAWSTPTRVHRDSPGEWNSSGDDDEPYKSGRLTGRIGPADAQAGLVATNPTLQRPGARTTTGPCQSLVSRVQAFRDRIVAELARLQARAQE
jgi:hypothetical protein